MLPGILGKKIGMTQLFTNTGQVMPVTVLETGPCYITQVKTVKTDGYNALQVGFDDTKKKKNTPKPLLEHFNKAKIKPCRCVREFRLSAGENGAKEAANFKLGDKVGIDIFENTWKVNVTGITKGHGFSGTVKMWNKKRGPESHGSMNVRGSGAIGSDTRLTHIRPGKHMPGDYGTERQTVRHLEVIRIDKERNLLFVKGAVPGPNRGYLMIKKTNLVKPTPPAADKSKKGKISAPKRKK